MVNVGYKMLYIFMCCTLLRFLLPFELPFSKNVLFPESVSFMISRVQHTLFTVSTTKISTWTLLVIIWSIGFLIQLIKHLKLRRKCRYNILSSSLDVSQKEPYRFLVERICQERGKRNCFEILEVTGIHVPMLYGVFSPKILIPENWEISEEHLHYVFYHEISHHFNHDLVFKNIVNIFAMVYWWNPFCHLLIKQTDIILEMRIDNKITQCDFYTIAPYLNCLVSIAEQAIASKQALIPTTLSVSFSDNAGALTKRFEMLMAAANKKHYTWNVILAILMFGIYVLSYMYTFEAHYMSPKVQNEVIELTEDNTYAIQKKDGTYDVYYGTVFVENVDSLEYYPDVPIYTEEKENNYEED